MSLFRFAQAFSLRGVSVTATVEEAVKGALPPFDQGTVGINVMPLGTAEVRQSLLLAATLSNPSLHVYHGSIPNPKGTMRTAVVPPPWADVL